MVLFENNLVIMSFEEDVPCFKYNHLRPVTSDELKEIWLKSIQLIKDVKQKYPQLNANLADTRKLGAIYPEMINYVNTVVDPMAAEQGIKKIAMIIPEDIFAQFNVEEYVESQNFGITKGIFGNETAAVNWLKS